MAGILRLVLRRKGGEGQDGYFSTIGGRILNSEAEVCTLGLGHLSEVVFHRRLLGGSFMEGVFVEEVDSGEEVGVQADGGKRRRVGRFGGGSSPPRVTPDYLMELMRGMSERYQATFKRNMVAWR